MVWLSGNVGALKAPKIKRICPLECYGVKRGNEIGISKNLLSPSTFMLTSTLQTASDSAENFPNADQHVTCSI